jgi:hypothetical protein
MKTILTIVIVLLLATPVLAEERPILAVFDMEDRGAGLSKETLNNLTDYLAAMLTEGGYQIIPRNQIRERLKQQQTESYKECFDQSCQIEMGKELAAQKSLSTKVLKIGKKCRVTGDLYDLKRAASEKAATAGSGCSEDELLAAVEQVAAKLTGKQVEPEPPPPEEPLVAPERVETAAERRKREKAERRRQTLERFRAGQSEKPIPPPPSEPGFKTPPPAKPPLKAKKTLADHVFNVTLKIGVLMPTLSKGEGLELDGTAIDTDSGLFFDMQADLRMGRTVAIGVYLYYASASGAVTNGASGDFSFLSVGARAKYVLVAGERFAFRPYMGIGYGTFLSGATYTGNDSGQQVSLEGASGLNIALAMELVYYFTDSLGAVIDFGMIAQGTGTKDQDGEEYDMGMKPMLFLLFGVEFGG